VERNWRARERTLAALGGVESVWCCGSKLEPTSNDRRAHKVLTSSRIGELALAFCNFLSDEALEVLPCAS
jgi:hypothetical protein